MISEVLQYKGYRVGPVPATGVNAVVCMEGIEYWSHPTDPQPTQQQLDAWAAEPAFQTWLAEHGGNSALTLRREAREMLDAINREAAILRALALTTLSEINLLRQWVTDFKAATAAATNLANLQTRVAALPNVPQRTAQQLREAIKQQVTDGSADK
jgi:hypothetical protein